MDTQLAPDGTISQRDIELINRHLMNAVSADIASDEAESLRRIRDHLKAVLRKSDEPVESEQDLYRRLDRMLRESVDRSGHPRPFRRRLALLQVVRSDWEAALKHLQRLGPASKEDIYHPLLLAYVYFHLGDYAKARSRLKDLDRLLEARRELVLRNPVFCSAITAYRLYTPRPTQVFSAGEDVLLYVEIEGNAFREEGGGEAVCRLSFDLTIKDDAQVVLWARPDYGDYNPTFRGSVRDMHACIALRVPHDLPPGRHHLFVTCRDGISGKEGSCAIPFRVRAAHAKPSDTSPETGAEPATPADYRSRMKDARELLRQRYERESGAVSAP